MGDVLLFLLGIALGTAVASSYKTEDFSIANGHAIYIKDVEYRCKAVTP